MRNILWGHYVFTLTLFNLRLNIINIVPSTLYVRWFKNNCNFLRPHMRTTVPGIKKRRPVGEGKTCQFLVHKARDKSCFEGWDSFIPTENFITMLNCVRGVLKRLMLYFWVSTDIRSTYLSLKTILKQNICNTTCVSKRECNFSQLSILM